MRNTGCQSQSLPEPGPKPRSRTCIHDKREHKPPELKQGRMLGAEMVTLNCLRGGNHLIGDNPIGTRRAALVAVLPGPVSLDR